MRKVVITLALSMTSILAGVASAFACTDFLIKTTDGCVINGRSMEWGSDLHCRLTTRPSAEKFISPAPGGKLGLRWRSKFGFVEVDMGNRDIALDGINEKGLSAGALWLPGTTYQSISPDQSAQALDGTRLIRWILGNFETVEAVKKTLPAVRVWCPELAEFGGVPTIHLALHDARGKSLVVEFIDGQQRICDNALGVLTNAPTFDWHMTNLRNYLTVSPSNPKPVQIAGTVLAPPGQGSGFLGIPGDWTPPSRFVRTTAMLAFAKPVAGCASGVNLAEHILNVVDIPQGAVRPAGGNISLADYTQWILIKDLTNRILYFRTYNNLTLRSLSLPSLNLSPGAKQQIIEMSGGSPAIAISAEEQPK